MPILPQPGCMDRSITASFTSVGSLSRAITATIEKKRVTMNDKEARREAVSQWFMEFSVLWAVFPLLDQLVENRPIDVPITSSGLGISLTALAVGLILRRGERT